MEFLNRINSKLLILNELIWFEDKSSFSRFPLKLWIPILILANWLWLKSKFFISLIFKKRSVPMFRNWLWLKFKCKTDFESSNAPASILSKSLWLESNFHWGYSLMTYYEWYSGVARGKTCMASVCFASILSNIIQIIK